MLIAPYIDLLHLLVSTCSTPEIHLVDMDVPDWFRTARIACTNVELWVDVCIRLGFISFSLGVPCKASGQLTLSLRPADVYSMQPLSYQLLVSMSKSIHNALEAAAPPSLGER